MGIARLLEGELRIPCRFPAWVEGKMVRFSEKQEIPGIFLPDPGALWGLCLTHSLSFSASKWSPLHQTPE